MQRIALLISPRGLLRCCSRTAFAWVVSSPEADAFEGDTLQCKRCEVRLRVQGGVLGIPRQLPARASKEIQFVPGSH
jgi:hypothetical protein